MYLSPVSSSTKRSLEKYVLSWKDQSTVLQCFKEVLLCVCHIIVISGFISQVKIFFVFFLIDFSINVLFMTIRPSKVFTAFQFFLELTELNDQI